jgi:hypothetical protein
MAEVRRLADALCGRSTRLMLNFEGVARWQAALLQVGSILALALVLFLRFI